MHFGIRELIFFAVLLAVPIASYVYVFQPRNEDIAQAQSEIAIKQSRLDRLAEVLSRIDNIGEAIDSGREAIEVIEAKLPTEQDVESILEQVWQIARRHQLTVRSVKGEKSVPAAMYMELPLRVAMEGHFDGFYQFLLELEKLPRITRIHQMEMKRSESKPGPNQPQLPPGFMRTEFILSIYFEPRAAMAG
jgi:type IV pilus assembly protein PilO